jgi:hypothetical protein
VVFAKALTYFENKEYPLWRTEKSNNLNSLHEKFEWCPSLDPTKRRIHKDLQCLNRILYERASCFRKEKVYLTPHLSRVVYFTLNYKTVHFTLWTFQNRSNYHPDGFRTVGLLQYQRYCYSRDVLPTVPAILSFPFLFIFTESLKIIVNHRKIIKWKI